MHNVRSEKISLRRLVIGDAEKIYQMSQETVLASFLPDQVYRDQKEAAEVIASLIESYDDMESIEHRPYVLGVMLNHRNELIGHIGVSSVDQGVEIGYAIEKKHQGYGYAQTAVHAMLRILATQTNILEVYGIVDRENIPSIKVLEKCGFSQVSSMPEKLVYKRYLIDSI